ARFCMEYLENEKRLMKHYCDLLKKDIRGFILAKNWKVFDELVEAAMEQELVTKKSDRLLPK
ncbi:hypothetical protein Tco_0264239, partial [Tanacetum coccineum]